MSFLKILGVITYIGDLLTFTGQLLSGFRNIPKVDRQDMSQDSSNQEVEDEKPAEDINHEFPFMRGQ